MKLAIIPPLCYSYQFGSDNYKLILPEHWQNQDHLQATMLNHRRGGFTILDNGIAEGKPVEWNELEKIARRYYVNEIVLPDVMGDAEKTQAAVEAVIDDAWHPTNAWGFMGVLQGKNTDECFDLSQYYLGLRGRGLRCIGIPRHLIETMGLEEIRYILARMIRSQDETIDIHLLGTNPNYITELEELGHYYRALGVRGVDTSAPFVYAAASMWIGSGVKCKRTPDYFDLGKKKFFLKLVKQNIDTLRGWIHG
jgi:hypothetical protein